MSDSDVNKNATPVITPSEFRITPQTDESTPLPYSTTDLQQDVALTHDLSPETAEYFNQIHQRIVQEFKNNATRLITPTPWTENQDLTNDPSNLPSYPPPDENQIQQINDPNVLEALEQRMQIIAKAEAVVQRQKELEAKRQQLKHLDNSTGQPDEQEEENIFAAARKGKIVQQSFLPQWGTGMQPEDGSNHKQMPPYEEIPWPAPYPRTVADRVARLGEVVIDIGKKYRAPPKFPFNARSGSTLPEDEPDPPGQVQLQPRLQVKALKIPRKRSRTAMRVDQLRRKVGKNEGRLKAGSNFSTPDVMQLGLLRELGKGWIGVFGDSQFLFDEYPVQLPDKTVLVFKPRLPQPPPFTKEEEDALEYVRLLGTRSGGSKESKKEKEGTGKKKGGLELLRRRRERDSMADATPQAYWQMLREWKGVFKEALDASNEENSTKQSSTLDWSLDSMLKDEELRVMCGLDETMKNNNTMNILRDALEHSS